MYNTSADYHELSSYLALGNKTYKHELSASKYFLFKWERSKGHNHVLNSLTIGLRKFY